MNIFRAIADLKDKNESFAIATIIKSKGSTPRHSGKMIIREDGNIIGTIGGGPAEYFVIKESLEAISNKQSKTVEFTLDAEKAEGLHMYCGGQLIVFIEVMEKMPRLILIGAGHVGHAIAKLAETVDYEIIIIDDRENYASQAVYPMASAVYTDPCIEAAIEQVVIDECSYIIIATKDRDEAALRKVIHSNAAYIGMIGSKKKVTKVFSHLEAEGISSALTDKVFAPIGLDIGSETPEEIAVSIIAEIMKVRTNTTGQSLKVKH